MNRCSKSAVIAAFTLFVAMPLTECHISAQPPDPLPGSVAAESGDVRTATEAELLTRLTAYAAADSRIELATIGRSTGGLPIRLLTLDEPNVGEDSDTNGSTPKFNVLILGGIHSGECCGKEALCELTREIIAGEHPEWLRRCRLFFVPSYNVDGNRVRGPNHRPGQVGPTDGVGLRENADGLDLNRDFMKAVAPETQALLRLINRESIDWMIDLHTTNGSVHRYQLTYDPPHHPQTPSKVTGLLRRELLPAVTKRLADQGIDTFYYGNFDRGLTRWSTFGCEGRYGTNYMGLRGGVGILSEAYSYATFRERIDASREFVTEILDYVSEHSEGIHERLARRRTPRPGDRIAIRTRIVTLPDPITILGYDPPIKADARGGGDRRQRDYRVRYEGRFEATESIELPDSYLIPIEETAIIDKLHLHGIETITSPSAISAEMNAAHAWATDAIEIADRPFQNVNMVRVTGRWRPTSPHQGRCVLVPIAQPVGHVAAQLLEPSAADSLVTWGIATANDGTYPVQRITSRR